MESTEEELMDHSWMLRNCSFRVGAQRIPVSHASIAFVMFAFCVETTRVDRYSFFCATQQDIDYWWISQLCCDTVPWPIPSASRIRCEFCYIESSAATYYATSIRVIPSSLPHGMSFHSTFKSLAFSSGSIRDLVLGLQSIM
jgi:hypothetical protein